jgi:hypothetical protein
MITKVSTLFSIAQNAEGALNPFWSDVQLHVVRMICPCTEQVGLLVFSVV